MTYMVEPWGKLQFIMTSLWDTWEAVTNAFDLTCCMVAIDGRGPDGQPRVRKHRDYSFPAAVARLPPVVSDFDPTSADVTRAMMRRRVFWQEQEDRTRERALKYADRGITSITYKRMEGPHQTFAATYLPRLDDLYAHPTPQLSVVLRARAHCQFGQQQFMYAFE